MTIIDERLKQRNYLMHHFFRTHNFAIYQASGRAVMVEELRGIRRKLDQADLALNAGSEFLDKLAGREEEPGSDAQKLVSQLMLREGECEFASPLSTSNAGTSFLR